MDTVDSGLPGGQSQAHWFDTWDRQTSQSFSNTAKGLRNAPGENNCFLNSAVQVFWHIDVFRRSYRRLSGHLCMGHSCIFCALKVIFTQFQYSDQSSLQPSGLRKALANTFAKQERFQLGHMDDAAECFENILNRIHYHIANMYNEDSCNAPHCVSHQKFAMMVFEQLVCPCGATSEPLKFHEMVHYISANALVSQSRAMQESGDMLHPNRFGLLLRNSRAVGDVRDCPGNCGKRVQIRKVLLNVPDVVSIGLVWGSDKADPELTTEVTRAIGTTILYPDMFHSVMCNDASLLPRLHLTSVVCYYGKHYSSFIYHTKLQEWVYFDDATVREVGPDWAQVVDHIISSRYQPLLLIYTNPNAQPVSTETAPSTRVMAPGYNITPNKDTQEETKYLSAADKNQSGSQNCRRSLTPSLEKSEGSQPKGNKDQTQNKLVSEKKLLERTSSFEHRRQTSFLLAVTKKGKEEAIYAVPHNNSKVINLQKDISQDERQKMYMKQNSLNYCGDFTESRGDPDCYNYTLSTSDQYRRPGFDTQDSNRFPLAQNFSRMGEAQRKDIAKKGKGKIPTDVIRCHVDGTQRNSQSSDSDQSSPVYGDINGLPVSGMNKPVLPVKSGSFTVRSLSVDDESRNVPVISETGSIAILHPVIKPKPGVHGQDNADLAMNTFTPVQLGLATLPRIKKPINTTSLVQPSSSSSSSSHGQQRGSQIEPQAANQYHSYPQDVTPPPPYLHVNPQSLVPTFYQNCLYYPNVDEQEKHSRQSSSSSILSQGSVIECPTTEDVKSLHCRQISTTSQDTLTDKPKETKSKSKKKDKDEKKRDENKLKKEEKKRKGEKREKGTKVSDKPSLTPDKKSSPNDEGFSEDKSYIDRRMVESVLSYQKLQRSGSCVSQVSTSSMESENFVPISGKGLVTPKDNLSSEIPFDSASLDSHKDSGYASSDRTSSSSTGSITMNPYEQYFMSRSMIPPRNLNNFKNSENLRKFMDQSVHSYTQEKDLKSLVSNPNEYQTQTLRYCQNSMNMNGLKSHSQSFLKDQMTSSKAECDQHLYDALSGREKTIAVQPTCVPEQLPETLQHGLQQPNWSKQRPGTNLVPNNVMPLQDGPRTTDKVHPRNQNPAGYAGNQTVYQTSPNPVVYPTTVPASAEYQLQPMNALICQPAVTQRRNVEQFQEPVQEAISQTGSDHFQKLCQVAEDFMDSCVLSETSEQYGDAVNHCQQAIDNLTKAMKLPNIGQSLYTYAQKTSNSCVIKLRSLQKRLLARPESSHSSNSSDSGINHEYRVQKPQPNFQAPLNGSKPPSRSSSQNSMDSLSANSSSSRSATPVLDKAVRPSTDDRVPSVEPHVPHEEYHNAYPGRRLETIVPELSANNNNDRYGSLPRRKTQRPPESTYRCISPGHEALVYKDMSDNQRQLNLHNRTNSGSITPVNELGYGDSHRTAGFVDQVVPVAVPTHSRQSNEQSTGPMYRPTGQHLRPIPVAPPKLQNQIQHTESQPDLRKLAMDSVTVPQRPLTPQVLCSEPIEEYDHRTSVSVKDLLNRFECVTVSTDLNKNRNLEQNVQPTTYAPQPVQLIPMSSVTCIETNDSSRVTLQRQRSKSESESLATACHPQKPKSVLSKKSKTEVGNKPRKSVTFSTDIRLVDATDDWRTMGPGNYMNKAPTQNDSKTDISSLTSLISLPRKSLEQARSSSSSSCSSSSSSSPVEAVGEGACALCHKLGVEHGQSYCAKCTYYMSRFTPARC